MIQAPRPNAGRKKQKKCLKSFFCCKKNTDYHFLKIERGGQFKNFPSKTDDQKSLPTAKNSEKVSRGKSHQKQAEAKLSLSSTNRDSNPTQPKPKYPRKRKNTAGGLPNSTKFPFKFKPMQDHFKSLGTKTTPTESKAETKEGQPKSAKTSPSKVTEEP